MREMPLWTGAALAAAMQARVEGKLPAFVSGVSIDTRTLQNNDVFFAIRGDAQDGHAWVPAAFQRGAAAAVVDASHAAALAGAGPLLVVDDVLLAMRSLGSAARARTAAHIMAVTGSVGKTSTKEALRHVLSNFGATHASVASYNNHWGVPLTLARMPKESQFGVFEIGMNHAGEIADLVPLVRPHVAIITTIAPVHLENLGSIEAIALAKSEIFTALEPAGTAILHQDVAQFDLLHARAQQAGAGRILSFGVSTGADARLVSVEPDGEGSVVEAIICGAQLRYKLGAPGRHMADNSLAVLLAALAIGIDPADAAATLEGVTPPQGRGRRVTLQSALGPFTLIDEAYNANPASMRAALDLLGETEPGATGRRIAVIGDMLELGPDGAAMHAELAEAIVRNRVDILFAAGPLARNAYDACPAQMRGLWAPTASDILDPLAATLREGDVVMIKASNGSRMGPVVSALITKFGAPTAAQSGT